MKGLVFIAVLSAGIVYGGVPPSYYELRYPARELPVALLEGAKQLYREGEWDKFFGVAGYAKLIYPTHHNTDEIRLLEVLGLLRHCQLARARAAIDSSLHSAGRHKDDLATLKFLLSGGGETHSGEISAPEQVSSDLTIVGRNVWKVEAKQLGQLSPFHLRKPVPILCESAGPG